MSDDPTDFNDLFGEPNRGRSATVSSEEGSSNPAMLRIVGGLGIAALALAFFTLSGGFKGSSEKESEKQTQRTETSENRPAKSGNILADKIEEVTGVGVGKIGVDWASEETKAINKAAVSALVEKIQSLESANLKVDELGTGIKSRLEGMKTSEAGSRIAADQASVAQFVAILDEAESAVKEDVEATVFLTEINTLLKKWEAASDWKYKPQPFVLERLDALLEKAESRQKALKILDDSIESLIAATSKNQASGLLATAIATRETDGQEELAARLAKVVEESRAAAIAQLEDRVRKSEAALAESMVKLEDAEKLARAQENNAAANRILEELENQKKQNQLAAEKRQLEREFRRDLAEIQTYLYPFLADGRQHRGSATGSGPISYSILVGAGVLEESAQGLLRLGDAGQNGRPLGGFPRSTLVDNVRTGYPGSESTARFLERSQQLLKKYGELLVEKGMLAK